MSDPSSETGADVYDVVIVGAGPAGLTAAIYASRGRLKTAVLERNMAGGQIALTDLVENYPGFPEGISGFDLSQKMKEQAEKFGAEMREIEGVAGSDSDARGLLRRGHRPRGRSAPRAVILAPGVEPRRSGIPGEAEFIGRGVSWCATCDGALYRGRTVAVIGGGDSAVEEGMFLTKFAEKVYLVHRRDELRAAPIAQERAFANPKFEFVWDSDPQADRRRRDGRGARGRERQDRVRGAACPVNGVFMYIGQIPNTDVAQGHRRAGRVRLHRHRRRCCAPSCRACSPAATPAPTRSSRSPWRSARARSRPCRPGATSTSSSAPPGTTAAAGESAAAAGTQR